MMNKRYKLLAKWLPSRLGQALLQEEMLCLKSFWQEVFGDYLLILGDPVQTMLANHCRFKHRLVITPNTENLSNKNLICASYEALPIEPNSVDAILLPHTLEFAENPYQVLREAEIALHPEGHLIVIGFNPMSLFGLRRLFSLSKQGPWSGDFRHAYRVKDWLQLLNFELTQFKRTFYRPPIAAQQVLKPLRFIEKFSGYLLPFFGGVYILMAKKKVFGATPLKVKWQALPKVVSNSVPKPVTREIHHETCR